MESKQSYTVESSDINFVGGRYISKFPLSAAKKAASRMFRNTNKNKIRFTLRRTTQGEDKKIYHYEGIRITLSKPITITLNGKEITYKYKVEVVSKEHSHSCPSSSKKNGGSGCNCNN